MRLKGAHTIANFSNLGVLVLQKNKVQEGIFYLRKAAAFPVEIDDDLHCQEGARQQLGSALEGTLAPRKRTSKH